MSADVRVVEPLVEAPAQELAERAMGLDTPALIYDLDGLRRSVGILSKDIEAIPGAQLNLALKACHTPQVLNFLARLGLGADVASIGEYEIAVNAGFRLITATGPSFEAADSVRLSGTGTIIDASSFDQLHDLCRENPDGAVGMRLRVPLPKNIEGQPATFGEHSRFGLVATDTRLHTLLEDTGCRLTRVHTHTGQMTPDHLLYKARYLLAVAEAFPDINTLNFGGGFFSLYANRSHAITAFEEVARLLDQWKQRTGRNLLLQFEPGGGILTAHGYLVATVTSVEQDHAGFNADIVTVDASAWNLAPWHRPQVINLSRTDSGETVRTLFAGNTLYENDFFGTDVRGIRTTFDALRCRAGDRLLLTTSGAYTMTNARVFNRIPLPKEYCYSSGKVQQLD